MDIAKSTLMILRQGVATHFEKITHFAKKDLKCVNWDKINAL